MKIRFIKDLALEGIDARTGKKCQTLYKARSEYPLYSGPEYKAEEVITPSSIVENTSMLLLDVGEELPTMLCNIPNDCFEVVQ